MGQVPYHGPHVVLSLSEARALKDKNDGGAYVTADHDSALEKIEWALTKSHPKFLIPHE